MLIDHTYFVGEILIPNLTGDNPVVSGNVEEINRFIKKYEKEYLLHVLGEDLYKVFIAGMAVEPIEAKWTDLKSKLIDTDIPASPIADYVYYHVMRDRFTNTSALGEVEAAVENGNYAVNSYKMARAYNEAVRYGSTLRSWLSDNIATYPEFDTAGSYTLRTVNIFGI